MSANRLRLNADKTKLLWRGSQYGFAVLGNSRQALVWLRADTVVASDHVCLLGVTISLDLSLKKHVSVWLHANLHWHDIPWRVQYNNTTVPSTWWTVVHSSLILPVIDTSVQLVVSSCSCLVTVSARFGRRTFSVADPMAWNALPNDLHDPTWNISTLCISLKLHYHKPVYVAHYRLWQCALHCVWKKSKPLYTFS